MSISEDALTLRNDIAALLARFDEKHNHVGEFELTIGSEKNETFTAQFTHDQVAVSLIQRRDKPDIHAAALLSQFCSQLQRKEG